MKDETHNTVIVTEKTPFNTDLKTIALIVGFTAAGVSAYISLKAESAEHGAKINAIQAVQRLDHDALTTMTAVVNSIDKNVGELKQAREREIMVNSRHSYQEASKIP